MLTFDNSVSFSQGSSGLVTLRNFWEPEDGFAWSTGSWCEIIFDFDLKSIGSAKSADVIMDIDAFTGGNEKVSPSLKIYFNGLRIATIDVNKRVIQISSLDTKTIRGVDNVLTIDTPNSHSPQIYGGDDYRVLGVQLFSLQFRRNA